MNVLIFVAVAYLLGSVSSAVIVCRIFRLPDPKQAGSKNPGTTNVLRLGGKQPALLTLAGDLLKGLIPVALAKMMGFGPGAVGMIAVAAFLGHLFPIFFNFQGGKGVATAMGVFLAMAPIPGLLIVGCWLALAWQFRYSSLAALGAAIVAPLVMSLLGSGWYLLPTLVITVLLIHRHLDNIKRLRAGTESRIIL